MAAIATLQLKNYATTETDFVPGKIDSQTGVVSYYTAGSSYDARSVATVSVTLPKVATGRIKVRGKVSIPVMDAVITTKKIDENLCSFEFSLPRTSTLTDRRNLKAYIADFLTDAVMTKAVEDFESPY